MTHKNCFIYSVTHLFRMFSLRRKGSQANVVIAIWNGLKKKKKKGQCQRTRSLCFVLKIPGIATDMVHSCEMVVLIFQENLSNWSK